MSPHGHDEARLALLLHLGDEVDVVGTRLVVRHDGEGELVVVRRQEHLADAPLVARLRRLERSHFRGIRLPVEKRWRAGPRVDQDVNNGVAEWVCDHKQLALTNAERAVVTHDDGWAPRERDAPRRPHDAKQ